MSNLRTVRVTSTVAEGNAILRLQARERFRVSAVAALAVRHWNAKRLAGRALVREGGVVRARGQPDRAADEAQALVADQGTWQQPGFD